MQCPPRSRSALGWQQACGEAVQSGSRAAWQLELGGRQPETEWEELLSRAETLNRKNGWEGVAGKDSVGVGMERWEELEK